MITMINKILGWVCLATFTYAVEVPNCHELRTTYDMASCISNKLDDSDVKMQRYFDRAIERYTEDKKVLDYLEKSQKNWIVYSDLECRSVSATYGRGTYAGTAYLTCKLELTKRRTYEIWNHHLTYMDSTPPILPEPKLY
jgi:uncharacterized protein YecT (DUF1311 family)